MTPLAGFPSLPGVPPAGLPLSLPAQAMRAQDVGRLFPVIAPSPAAAPAPAAAPSGAAHGPGQAGHAGQGRHRAPARGRELALSEPLTGSGKIGLAFVLFLAAGALAWLLLRETRKRRVP